MYHYCARPLVSDMYHYCARPLVSDMYHKIFLLQLIA